MITAPDDRSAPAPTDAEPAAEDWLARALDRLGVGLFVVDHRSQQFRHANDALARLLGAPSGQAMEGRSILELYPDPKERAEIAARLMADEEFRRTGRAQIQVRRLHPVTRELMDMTISLAAAFDAAGQLVSMDCALLRVAPAGVHERAFRQSEERFRVLFDTNATAMALADLSGHLTRVNTEFCRFTGRAEPALLGSDLFALLHAEDQPERPRPGAGRGGGLALGERRFLQPDGGVRWGLVTWSWLSDEGGAPHSAVIVIQDVSERKQVEQSLQRMARLESLGLLAGGIAHDFNNTLAVVLNSLNLAERQPELGALARQFLQDARSAAERSAELTWKLRTFAQAGAPAKRVGSLEGPVREVARRSGARVEVRVAPGLWRCTFDPGQLQHVFTNLVLNAVEAMPGGGLTRIEVGNEQVAQAQGLPLPPGRYVCVAVTDQGVGIEPQHLERIFDPYFTTKRAGSGLGLATAHAIVARHGGHIAVESLPERGSTFRVYLPATDAEEAEPLPRPASAPPARARLLVMDDEPGVRKVALHILSGLGLEADGVADGEEAVAAYRAALAAGRPYQAVLLDLTVSRGLGGEETLARLRQLDPGVRAIVTSGYTASPAMAEWRERGFAGALEKPYLPEALGEVVAAVLAPVPASRTG